MVGQALLRTYLAVIRTTLRGEDTLLVGPVSDLRLYLLLGSYQGPFRADL